MPNPCNISVIVPVKNEAGNILPLVHEIVTAMPEAADYEIIYVNDASTDNTLQELAQARATHPQLRVFHHAQSTGQSGALRTALLHARGELIITLDSDGQNDPADIPRLIAAYQQSGDVDVALVAGQRRKRQDTLSKRLSSKIANRVRRLFCEDGVRDTGCGLKLIRRNVFLRLPFFNHIHRYIPALVLREGLKLVTVDVNHRPRGEGRSHYTLHNRLWVGIVDLFGLLWLRHRMRHPGTIREDQ